MKVLRQELKFQTRSILVWTISTALVLLLFMGIFPSFAREAETLKKAMTAFPKLLLDSIGLDVELIFEAGGFVSYIYGMLQVFLAVMGALYAFSVVGREKGARMNDFLFVKPVSRTAILLQKILASFIAFLILTGVILLLFLVMGRLWDMDAANLGVIQEIVWASFLLQIFFFALASVIAVLLKKIKSPVGAATGLAFFLYFILLMGRIMDEEVIKKLSPFGFVVPLDITLNHLSLTTVGAFLGLTILCLALTTFLLNQRDLEV